MLKPESTRHTIVYKLQFEASTVLLCTVSTMERQRKFLLCLVGFTVSLLVCGHHITTKKAIIDRPILDVQLGVAQSNVSDTKSSSKKAYVKTFHYSGQQAAAIRGMDSLQCFLSSMKQPFALVEPYITAEGIEGYTDAPDRMHFGDIFDMEHFNSKYRQMSGVEMVTMNEYGPQPIIIALPGFKAEVLWPPKKINEERSLRPAIVRQQ